MGIKPVVGLSRRQWLQYSGIAASSFLLPSRLLGSAPLVPTAGLPAAAIDSQPNGNWNGAGPLVVFPQKHPLILLTDRPVQLETPRAYFSSAITPNAAFYVRWHLDGHPQIVDLKTYRLQLVGAVHRPKSYSLSNLMRNFPQVSVTAVNQCSGNSRSFVMPRVAGTPWGHGAMGCATWTGVRLRDVLASGAPRKEALAVRFEGLDTGSGPKGSASQQFSKSLEWGNTVIDECILAYRMNGAPLPLLNGFPLRLVVPGYFGTYWVKCLGTIRVLDQPDDAFWTRQTYLVPDLPMGNISPALALAKTTREVPIGRMPPRALIVSPDGSSKIPAGFPFLTQGLAFSGHGAIARVDVSWDGGNNWQAARLGEDFGRHAFRTWTAPFQPVQPGRYTLIARALDAAGNSQGDAPFWNPKGYGYARLDRQEVVVGHAGE